MDDVGLTLNLSFVLREPSTSRTVKQATRASKRFMRSRSRLLQRFTEINDEDFLSRLIADHRTIEAVRKVTSNCIVVSAHAGLHELLPRALRLLQSNEIPPVLLIDDTVGATASPDRPLFGSPANLHDGSLDDDSTSVLVAGMLVRPGDDTVMLWATHISGTESPSRDQDVLRSIEALLRDYVDQWIPPRPMWNAPIEVLQPDSLIKADVRGGDT
jgi:hypothetical protein